MKRPVDPDKLRQKIQYIREALRHLEEIRERGKEAFLADSLLQAAATRYLQTGIEAMLDAAHHIVAREGLGLPQTYRAAIDLLARHKILPQEKAPTFRRMVKFRNRAVHLYDEIDPSEIYSILEHHLTDFDDFVEMLVKRYFEAREK